MESPSVIVVTISEQLPCHGNKSDVVVFSSLKKAIDWIETQIATLIQNENLSLDAVDGWFVEFKDINHTIQYSVNERVVC